MNFIITQSDRYWGSESNYSDIYRQRYGCFDNISLEELANNFTKIFMRTNKINLTNPVSQCHEVGLRFREEFIGHTKYLHSN